MSSSSAARICDGTSHKRKKEVAHHRHVIMGFSLVPNPKYNMDIDRLVANYAHRIVASRGCLKRPGFHGDFLPMKWRKDHGNQAPLIEAVPA